MQASIDIYLHERGYMHSVRKSRKFASSKAVWKEKHELFTKTEREGDQIKLVALFLVLSLVLSS